MNTVLVDQDGRVILPAHIREMTGVKPGQHLVAVPVGRTIVLTPEVKPSDLRGLARGADPTGYRDR
jgi:bifunctional DNA-binding transcriptional regulator/antitoxin component of YhaV-PrlF toxin-antitoxin module